MRFWIPFQSSIDLRSPASTIFGLTLQGLDALQAADKTKVHTAALEATDMQLSTKFNLLDDNERGLTNVNRRLQQQVVALIFDSERCEACESADKRAINAW